MTPATAREWERLWATYDEPTYSEVLKAIRPDDVVLEIGAGDLRLARRMANIARQVIAWEIQADVLQRAGRHLPGNLTAWQVDALLERVPNGVTTAVLLMRHCQHFLLYANRLHAAGCQRLITNARWGMDIEIINLQLPRILFGTAPMGWYACWCGDTGFKAGPPEYLTPELETAVHEVIDCPSCRQLAN
ncbi:MAG: rRNA adenine methyltransferase [Chloroflexi bacterium]|nr:rRNA adenine methyltransferase [Chloroflexota bacterium]